MRQRGRSYSAVSGCFYIVLPECSFIGEKPWMCVFVSYETSQ